MRELKCPKCGSVFSVDEADYASIVSQVRGAEFESEVTRRIAELHARQEAERKAREAEAVNAQQRALFQKDQALNQKDGEISRLKAQLAAMGEKQQLEINAALQDKDMEITRLSAALREGRTALENARKDSANAL